jgi:hypothetical protein
VTTLRDVFKHNLLSNKPFAEENPVYEDVSNETYQSATAGKVINPF